MTPVQKAEVRRLVEEEGLSEKTATLLVTERDQPLDVPPEPGPESGQATSASRGA